MREKMKNCLVSLAHEMKRVGYLDLEIEAKKWCSNCRIVFDALFGDHTHIGGDVTIGEAHEKFPCTTENS